MPFVKNPTDQDLFCAAAGRVVPARGEIEVTEAEAALVPDHVFEVGADPTAPVAVAEELVAADPGLDPAVADQVVAAAEQIEAAQSAAAPAAQPAQGA